MKKWIQQHPSMALTLALYAGALVLFFAVHLVGFVQNRIGAANGTLAPVSLTLADFDFIDMEQRGENELYCTGTDPRMMVKDKGQMAASVMLDIDYSLPPELVNVFWAGDGQEYSVRRMAYAQDDTGSLFYLPAGGAGGIRIDPGVVAGNTLTVHGITLNVARPVWAFFVPSAGETALLVILPGLCACALAALREAGRWPHPTNRRKKAGDARG